ncbi:MAG: hypothetical protein WB622_17105 [Acidobacteriaceae bacterium]
MQHFPRPGEPRHYCADGQFESFGNLSIRKILKVKEDDRQSMPFIQAFQTLVEREGLIQIGTIRVKLTQFPEFLCHFIKRDLNPVVAFAIHLGIAVSEYANQPTLHRLYIAQTGARSIRLKKCFLRQLFRIRPGAGPPIGNPVEESMVLPYPTIEDLIADLHCRG